MERTPVSFGPGVFLFYGGTMVDKVFKTDDMYKPGTTVEEHPLF